MLFQYFRDFCPRGEVPPERQAGESTSGLRGAVDAAKWLDVGCRSGGWSSGWDARVWRAACTYICRSSGGPRDGSRPDGGLRAWAGEALRPTPPYGGSGDAVGSWKDRAPVPNAAGLAAC